MTHVGSTEKCSCLKGSPRPSPSPASGTAAPDFQYPTQASAGGHQKGVCVSGHPGQQPDCWTQPWGKTQAGKREGDLFGSRATFAAGRGFFLQEVVSTCFPSNSSELLLDLLSSSAVGPSPCASRVFFLFSSAPSLCSLSRLLPFSSSSSWVSPLLPLLAIGARSPFTDLHAVHGWVWTFLRPVCELLVARGLGNEQVGR